VASKAFYLRDGDFLTVEALECAPNDEAISEQTDHAGELQ
jgi:hypothetical protein